MDLMKQFSESSNKRLSNLAIVFLEVAIYTCITMYVNVEVCMYVNVV